jgi:uncharacterized protein
MISRLLKIDLPQKQSCFLWGARQTGKTTFLRKNFKKSIYYDFLKRDLYISFLKTPSLLREEVLGMTDFELSNPIILDEIQKLPDLLDEVHWLIENTGASFILSGSSARKLRRGHSNLLGGRAWRFEMYPLTTNEIKDFDLLKALNHGLIPSHYLSKNVNRSLKAYVIDYLKEEIFDEGLTRNLAAFSKFLDVAGYSNGELLNYTNIARECGVDSKTIKEYFQILQDTLIGSTVEPFKKRQERNVISKAQKFYFFDVGIANYISKTVIQECRGELFGKSLEHLIYMELLAYRSYSEKDFPINFWRTKQGQEVDFVLGSGAVAIEIKGKEHISNSDLRHLKAFYKIYSPQKSFLVNMAPRKRLCGDSIVINWEHFLKELWEGHII